MGHLEAGCGKRGQEVAEIYDSDGTIMSHVELIGGIFTVSSLTIQEIPAQITTEGREPINTNIFPDSGASICLAGTSHLKTLNINEKT